MRKRSQMKLILFESAYKGVLSNFINTPYIDGNIYECLLDLFSVTFIVWFFIIPAPNEILKVKRSKNGYIKLKKSFSIMDRILRRKYVENAQVCVGYQYFFIIANYAGYFCFLTFIVLCIISLFTHDFLGLIRPYVFLKGGLVEFPLLIFTLCNYRGVNTLKKKGYWTTNWKFLLVYDKKAQEYYNKRRR